MRQYGGTTGRFIMMALLVCAGAVSPGRAELETYNIDPDHTAITFKIRHFFSKVPGRFNSFEGTIKLDPSDYTKSSVEVTIDAASIDTDEPARDKHLRSGDFFDVENHPKMTFKSTKVTPAGEKKLTIEGDLTIRGITKKATLDAEVLGFGKVYGVERAAFVATTSVDRTEFNVSWNDVVEGGGAILGNTVEIELNVQAKKAKPEAAAEGS